MTEGIKLLAVLTVLGHLIGGCSTVPHSAGSWMENSAYSKSTHHDHKTHKRGQPLSEAADQIEAANKLMVAAFPRSEKSAIKLWVTDSHNLADGVYTNNFGDKLSPAPGIKMHKIMQGSNVITLDPLHVPPCAGMENNSAHHWVLRSFIMNYDENLNRTVEGFFPNIDTADIQAEIDNGDRAITDRFDLKAKITDCRSGRIIYGAEESFLKTAISSDKSVYLFGKSLGMFYRDSKFIDPGLNQTRDLAMDMFLSGIAMDIVGDRKSLSHKER